MKIEMDIYFSQKKKKIWGGGGKSNLLISQHYFKFSTQLMKF